MPPTDIENKPVMNEKGRKSAETCARAERPQNAAGCRCRRRCLRCFGGALTTERT